MEFEWLHWSDEYPTVIGWYPIVLCWDEEEGSFMDAMYWDGEDWESSSGLNMYYPVSFESKEEAEKFAHEHDISF